MATRMQQRRGTASQWTTANPILAAGEIGFESDTGEFRVGDGVNHWDDLSPFKNIVDLGGNLDDYVLLTSVGDPDGVAPLDSTGQISDEYLTAALTYADGLVDGLDTSLTNDIATAKSAAESTAQGYVSTHASDTTDVHGITDTANIVYTSALTSGLSGKQDVVSGVSSTEIGYLDGVTSAIQTQINGKAATSHSHVISDVTDLQTSLDGKAALAGATFTGNVEVDGNLVVDGDFTVNGTNFAASATTITIEDNLVQLAHQNAANTVDLGIVVGYNDGAAKHSGIVRDVSDDTWKLFKGVTTEPTTTVNFGQGSLDNLAVNNITAAGVVFTDGTQTLEGVPSRTVILQRTESNTLSGVERDDLIEMASSSAMTLTIPTDSTFNFPIGTSIDVLQTSTGQVTIAGAGGVTVNATPGLKLRTQWSSATLFKRAANTWVVYGDLSA